MKCPVCGTEIFADANGGPAREVASGSAHVCDETVAELMKELAPLFAAGTENIAYLRELDASTTEKASVKSPTQG